MGFLQTLSYGTGGAKPAIKRPVLYRPFYFLPVSSREKAEISDFHILVVWKTLKKNLSFRRKVLA